VTQLFGAPVFDYAKPSELIKLICKSCTYQTKGGIILDFFSGSATTAHAVMKLNAEDGGNRKFIMVQLPEETDPKSDAYKAGYKNICEIGEERIRRGGKKVIEEQHSPKSEGGLFDQLSEDQRIDVGYRLLKLDSSNMNDVYYRPEEFSDQLIKEDNVKEDRTPEDLLFQVMLECNLPLSANIKTEKIAGKEVFSVNNGYLVACFDEDVNEEVIKDVAKRKPYFFVMRDSSLASDNVADNFEQIFQAYSKETIRRIL
jgi:adenine-specific DNA-methyltransferase